MSHVVLLPEDLRPQFPDRTVGPEHVETVDEEQSVASEILALAAFPKQLYHIRQLGLLCQSDVNLRNNRSCQRMIFWVPNPCE